MAKNYPTKKSPSSKPILAFTTANPPTFLDLLDTINSYAGQADKFLIVKADEQGIGVYAGDVIPDKNYVHTQIAAATVWSITHNLAKYPSVQAIRSGGYVIPVIGTRHLNENSLQITFSEAISGIAVCN